MKAIELLSKGAQKIINNDHKIATACTVIGIGLTVYLAWREVPKAKKALKRSHETAEYEEKSTAQKMASDACTVAKEMKGTIAAATFATASAVYSTASASRKITKLTKELSDTKTQLDEVSKTLAAVSATTNTARLVRDVNRDKEAKDENVAVRPELDPTAYKGVYYIVDKYMGGSTYATVNEFQNRIKDTNAYLMDENTPDYVCLIDIYEKLGLEFPSKEMPDVACDINLLTASAKYSQSEVLWLEPELNEADNSIYMRLCWWYSPKMVD